MPIRYSWITDREVKDNIEVRVDRGAFAFLIEDDLLFNLSPEEAFELSDFIDGRLRELKLVE